MKDVLAKASVEPFQIRPLPPKGGSCPRCLEPLEVIRVRFPGWRSLLEGACHSCGHRYLQDLPTGHGLVYPSTLDLDTGEVLDEANATWFSSWLRPAWESPDGRPVRLSVKVNETRPEGVLLNCLDPVYGHSILKLLNAQRELERSDQFGCVLLVPSSLALLTPPGAAEVWEVREPTSRFGRWLLELEERIAAELERFERCLLSAAFPHPHPSGYDLARFVETFQPERVGDPSIVLSLRDDRLWGADEEAQAENVARFWERLTATFPKAGCAAVGVGGIAPMPQGPQDFRSRTADEELERRWLAMLRGADLVVGVHGSNMLLPSGLARATIELLPEERYGNVFQATLITPVDPVTALATHRTIYGNRTLSDVSGERVAAVAASVLTELDRFETLMRGPASGESPGAIPLIPASPASAETAPPSDLVSRFRAAGWKEARRRIVSGLRTAGAAVGERGTAAAVKLRARRIPLPSVLKDERGALFELETRDEVEAFLQHRGHFERDVLNFCSSALETGMTALDIGASIGAFTASFGRAVRPEGTVHAFEPLEASRRRLLRTLELNALDNVTVSAAALSDEVGSAELFSYGPGYESWSTLAPRTIELGDRMLEATTSSTVQTTTLDRYCEDARIEKIDLLKIDVEGAEQRVLRGASRLLDEGRIALVLVEVSDNTLHGFGDHAYKLLEFLELRGLRPHVLDGGRLRPFRIAGEHRQLSNVLALSFGARARMREEIT